MSKVTCAKLLLDYLVEEQVEYVFGVPGATNEPLISAFTDQPKIKPVLTKHEQGASYMADGYARVSGRLGACFATSGPGAANITPGVAPAKIDGVPMIVLTGQVPTFAYGKGTFQDTTYYGVDSVQMMATVTKHSVAPQSKEKFEDEVRDAIRHAMTGRRGPVHLSLPKDILAEEITGHVTAPKLYRPDARYFSRELVIEAAKKLVHARKPVILMGSGSAGAARDILELAEMLNIPVATTPRAKGVFAEDHELSLGVLGGFSASPAADEYLRLHDIDVLTVIGSGLNQMVTESWDPRIAPTDCLIQIDLDPTQIGRIYRAHIGLVGDAATIITEISFRVLRYLKEVNPDELRPRKEVLDFKAEHPRYIDPDDLRNSDAVPLKPQRMIRELQDALPDDVLLFVDTGNHTCWAMHYLELKPPQRIFCAMGMLPMGYAIPASIGGKFAAPDRPVICLTGDGCFLMNGMEVATAAEYDIPVVFIIQNNGQLGLLHTQFENNLGPRNKCTTFRKCDFAKVAEGLGVQGFRVGKPGELAKLLPEALAMGKPVVIDVDIDPTEEPPIWRYVEGVKNFIESVKYV